MKIKIAKHKDALHHRGITYPKDEEGFCEIPEPIARQAGFVKRNKFDVSKFLPKDEKVEEETAYPEEAQTESIDEPNKEPDKAALVDKAVELGLGARSSVARRGIARLEREIAEATKTDED